ncbi:MAG TPA: pilus assembly protein PilM [Acidobacteriota bacterium]|nr:pilus assembly protein PilM [Acidobacteriota bacterium]
MMYLKTGIGIEFRGEDMLISAYQSNFSSAAFTHFKRIAGYRLRDNEDVRREISTFFRTNGLARESILLGLPRGDVVLRHLDFPPEVADNLEQVIRYQVQSYEPTEEDRFYYDYAVMNRSKAQKRIKVLLVTIRKNRLDESLRLLLDFDIRPVGIINSSIGLTNIFLHGHKQLKEKTFLLADVREESLELIVLRDGELLYSRETFRENQQSWKEIFLKEVGDAVSAAQLTPQDNIEKIVLAGESSEAAYNELKGLAGDFEPFSTSIRLTMPVENSRHLQDAASCLGLAFSAQERHPAIGINLLPRDLRMRQTRWAYVPTIFLAAIILVLLAGLGLHHMIQNRNLVGELEREIQSLSEPVKKVQDLQAEAGELETKVKLIEQLLHNDDRNLEVLQELTEILPADTFLRNYSNRDGTIQLMGLSGSSSDLIPMLEQSSYLKDVVQRGTIARDAQTGRDRFQFEAKLEE